MKKERLSRREFLCFFPPALVGLLVGCASEVTPTKTPIPQATPTPKDETPTPSPTPSPETQELPTATPTPERKRFVIGEINFIDEENPIDIVYPKDFTGTEKVAFKNLDILIPDASGEKERIFHSQFGGNVFVYSDIPSGTIVLNLHDAHLRSTGQPLEAEPLRELIEGNLRNPYPEEQIETNLEKIIGFPFLISQKGQTSKFVITQAKRMNAEEVKEFENKPQELSLFLEPIKNPENSFLLLTCSGRQPDEPNEIFPGRFVFILQHSPLE